MSTIDSKSTPVIPPEVLLELAKLVDRLAKRTRDPESLRLAAEEMDLTREELRKRSGELNVAVDLVRESREEP